eukprot:scaffold127929_cov16-Tisochrysis_lutea.AAC.1
MIENGWAASTSAGPDSLSAMVSVLCSPVPRSPASSNARPPLCLQARTADAGELGSETEAALVAAGREAIARTFHEEGVCEDLWGHVLHETVITPQEWKRSHPSILDGSIADLWVSFPPTGKGAAGAHKTALYDMASREAIVAEEQCTMCAQSVVCCPLHITVFCGPDMAKLCLVLIDCARVPHRYSIEHGAVFGLSHGLSQLAYFRPGARTDVDGFYLVGASARPGNGVPLVMISADLTAKRVLQDLRSSCK